MLRSRAYAAPRAFCHSPMRLFVALEIPPQVLDEVARFRAEIEPRWPRARWVRVAGIHLTLVFLGETSASALPELERALAMACAVQEPFSLAVRGGGTFPPRGPARVAWLGIEAPEELACLQRSVEAAACSALGLTPERRPFSPHLTLARPDPPWSGEYAASFARAAARSFGSPFEVRRAVLVESHLGAGGSRYEIRASLPLAGEGEVLS